MYVIRSLTGQENPPKNYTNYKTQVLTIRLVIKQYDEFTQSSAVGYKH